MEKHHSVGRSLSTRMACVVGFLLLLSPSASAKQLKPETVAAFDGYVQLTEARMNQELNSGPYLWIDGLPAEQRDLAYARLRRGEVITRRMQTLLRGHPIEVPDGLVHHWVGLVFIPGASLDKTMALLQDYDDQYKFYAPEVERSQLIRRNGNHFHVYLRLRRKKVLTVVLNTEYDVDYNMLQTDRASASSRSTRIAEVQHAGEGDESEKPVGDDDGFLWRLNSYWRFEQGDGGIYVQLEAVSLTRDIPGGLGSLVRPFMTSVPQESLEFTLSHTRSALCRATDGGRLPGYSGGK